MIAFFDTNVHADLLRGTLTFDAIRQRVSFGTLRISPVVASELLRGTRGRARRAVDILVDRLAPIEPPSWRSAFLEAGRLLPDVFADHEAMGLARLQNDMLLALTARHTGAMLVTRDKHFTKLRESLPFECAVLP